MVKALAMKIDLERAELKVTVVAEMLVTVVMTLVPEVEALMLEVAAEIHSVSAVAA